MSFLPVTCDAARGLQCPKKTGKRYTENPCTSFKPTRTHVDRMWSIFRTFGVAKQYHIVGNTVVNSYSKFGTMMTGIFLRKWLSFARWKSFQSLGCVWGALIRWPIYRSNRFSDFLRLDRLDRFGKIIKSIFSKLWKRESQFFWDFQNFFGFLKFREKQFFLSISQISCRYVKRRCILLVDVFRCGQGGPWFETEHNLRNSHERDTRKKCF